MINAIPWGAVRRFNSSDRRVFKYVFTQSDAVAEAVLYRYPEFEQRTVICCSTQSGCPVGCVFCGTGKQFTRNLLSGEIVAQVEHCLLDHNIDASKVGKLQIMFMSMGEPMLNLGHVEDAIRSLSAIHPNADLLVSTMGPSVSPRTWEKFFRLSCDIDEVGLQFSVHESTDEARERLIPYKAKLTLSDISKIGMRWHRLTGRRPFFNYCAHAGNASPSDADRLMRLFYPEIWECTVSVVCERDESVRFASERQREFSSRFMDEMLNRNFSVRMFDPAGQDDIGGGCGQLWFTQKWMAENGKERNK